MIYECQVMLYNYVQIHLKHFSYRFQIFSTSHLQPLKSTAKPSNVSFNPHTLHCLVLISANILPIVNSSQCSQHVCYMMMYVYVLYLQLCALPGQTNCPTFL